MDIVLDEDHTLIRDTIREFLEAESTPALVRAAEREAEGMDRRLWARFCELGWAGLCLSPEAGGQGLPLTYLGLLFEELGRSIAPLPAHGTLIAAQILDRHARTPALRAPLAALAEGGFVACLGLPAGAIPGSVAGHGRLTGRRNADGAGVILDGTLRFVEGHAGSDAILLAFHLQDDRAGAQPALALIDARADGITAVPLVTTAKDSQSDLTFAAVAVPEDRLLAVGPAAERLIRGIEDLAVALNVAMMAGGARRALEFAAEYAKGRVAFGHPIGSFQAIQHLSADMLNAVDGAELLVREAMWRLDQGLPATVEVAQAKAFASERCVMVCRSAQQIHGGIGFMMEFDLQLWYRRVLAWSLRWGRADAHRARVAAALLDGPQTVRLDRPLYAAGTGGHPSP